MSLCEGLRGVGFTEAMDRIAFCRQEDEGRHPEACGTIHLSKSKKHIKRGSKLVASRYDELSGESDHE